MTHGSKTFIIKLNDTTYTTDNFKRANQHLETILLFLGLLNSVALAQALMVKIFFECDTISMTINDDTLEIRKI